MIKLLTLVLILFAPIVYAMPGGGGDGVDGIDGQDGADGIDGVDGIDGIDGIDGVNGIDGIDGIDGVNGLDGLDGNNGVNGAPGLRGFRGLQGRAADDFRDYLAATTAAQIYLPQGFHQNSRITFGVSRVNGVTGLGIGYAYALPYDKDNAALTLSLGVAGNKVAGTVSVGFEF